MKIITILPIIAAILCVSTNMAFAQTEPYLTGYNGGFNNETNPCGKYFKNATDVGPNRNLWTLDNDYCGAGFKDGRLAFAVTTQEYKDGYILGKNDSIAGVKDTSACDNTFSNSLNACVIGYQNGYSDYSHLKQPDAIIKILKQNPIYKVGFAGGYADKIEEDVCYQYANNSQSICQRGYENGFNPNLKSAQTEQYKQGFALGDAP